VQVAEDPVTCPDECRPFAFDENAEGVPIAIEDRSYDRALVGGR
jgi:hypothetical protein